MPGTKSVTRPVGTRSGVYVVCTWITVPPAPRQARASATKFATASSACGTGSKPVPEPDLEVDADERRGPWVDRVGHLVRSSHRLSHASDLTGARHTGGVPDTPPLWVDGLTRSYGRLVGLDKLDLTLKAGECVALIGANGSGKSTAIRTMAGLLEPSGGSVRICGHDPHTEPDAEEARAALALVPDTPLLYDDLTVRQHLGLVALAHGVLDEDTPARIDALIDQLGLTERADFLPTELSRGLRQKTGLACALIRPSRVLMLDEPVVGLDPPSQALLRQLLLDAKAEGKAILLTTHQMRFADGIADRAIVLGDGKVLDRGRWKDVRGRAADRGWLPDDA